MPRRTFTSQDKGQPIEVIRGNYKGRSGWLHKGYDETEDMVYVILNGKRNKKGDEEVKHIYKTSYQYPQGEPQLWEQAMLKNPKVEPAYQTFLLKLLECEFEPTPETLAVIWKDWQNQYAARVRQNRCRGIIRIRTDLQHPGKRKPKKDFHEAFESAKGVMV